MTALRKFVNIFIFLLFAGLSAAAQGAISGQVTDGHGAVLPGAKVVLAHDPGKGSEIQKTTANEAGEYSFANVPFGSYRLKVTARGINREFYFNIELNSSKPTRSNVVFSLAPCSDEEDLAAPKITPEDNAEIVRILVGVLTGTAWRQKNSEKPIMSPENFSRDWLSSVQLSKVSIMTGVEINELTEKSGSLTYYTIGKPVQKGPCVSIAIANSVTVPGQIENANMAGGSNTYEFRKVDGKWTWLILFSTIS